MTEVLLSDEQLQERLVYWQEKLRLQDWIIEVKIASVKILDPFDYPDNIMGERDMENDLVHELLHLHLAPISDHFGNGSELYSTFEEQAIESIAFGLIEAERK